MIKNVKLKSLSGRDSSVLVWIVVSVFSFCTVHFVQAQAPSQDYVSFPATLDEVSTPPMVMLLLSRDQELWRKAYNDYSDLDGDGRIDTTYNNNFRYAGYFSSDWCYRYDGMNTSTSDKFVPDEPANGYKCNNRWSGNFLNWLTMTRVDIVRKVLYGGFRVVDTAEETVLQRAFIPSDVHAFVKVVRNSELADGTISDYTPINDATPGGVYSFCNVTHPDGEVEDWSGLTSGAADERSNAYRPRLKVASGAHPTWAGSERQQCLYYHETVGIGERLQVRTFIAFAPGVATIDHLGQAIPAPPLISGLGAQYEFSVRVAACGGDHGRQSADCRAYTSDAGVTTFKPFGVLQYHGETGAYRFGLMTGDRTTNNEGGVLRKNISFFGGAQAVDTDREIDLQTGQFRPVNGIVSTLDGLRIRNWRYRNPSDIDSTYADCSTHSIGIDRFRDARVGEAVDCSDWGNPISEMYLEAIRYFAGLGSPTGAFAVSGSPTWIDPFNAAGADSQCANCSIVVLSTGQNMFDGDNLEAALAAASSSAERPNLPGLTSLGQLNAFTNRAGSGEALNGRNFIVGNGSSGGIADECDAKAVTNLSDVRGICPEVPALRGTYAIAGAAHYARTRDLRPDIEGRQTLKTYTVRLAESIPSIEVEIPPSDPAQSALGLTIVPTCRSSSSNNNDGNVHPDNTALWQPCSLVDLTVVELRRNAQGKTVYGRFVIAWEDSPWGNDYDNDAYAVLEFCSSNTPSSDCEIAAGDTLRNQFGYSRADQQAGGNYGENIQLEGRQGHATSPAYGGSEYRYNVHSNRPAWPGTITQNQVAVRVSVVAASAGNAMKFGYVVSGASGGSQSLVNEIVRYGGYNFNSVALTGTHQQRIIWSQNARSFEVTGAAPDKLQNPLWFAAKYGAFNERSGADDDNAFPNLLNEWDEYDLDGNLRPDGIPDAHFPLRNPGALAPALDRIFTSISSRASSGSSIAINTENGRGEGIVAQSFFMPEVRNQASGEAVYWIGDVHGLFVDDRGRIREDNPGDGVSGDGRLGSEDRVLVYTESTVRAFPVGSSGDTSSAPSDPFTLFSSDFHPVWSAQERLAELNNVTGQRSYNSVANSNGGRYIFTAVDVPQVDSSDDAPARNGQIIIDDGSPDRTLAFDSDTFDDPQTYGRLLHLPLPANSQSSLDTELARLVNYIRGQEYPDDTRFRSRTLDGITYRLGDIVNSSPVIVGESSFSDRYKHRRRVVYVGANDGMLHAFNAGFVSENGVGYTTTSTHNPSATAHPLGAELWAYIPYNLLPHLKWLASPNYQRISFVDGAVQVFEARIFDENNENDAYPDGWGTILVVGLRFGGGEYTIPATDTDEAITTRSAYVIMDVTDPEQEPKLIAELSDVDLGFTTGKPALVRADNGSTDGGWYLVFGSGPRGNDAQSRTAALRSGVSNGSAKLYVFDLEDKTFVSPNDALGFDLEEPNSFVGDISAVDWTGDLIDDAIYFGIVNGSPQTPGGKLKRGRISYRADGSLSQIHDSDLYRATSLPFSTRPSTRRDFSGTPWVFAGTGRFFVAADNLSVQSNFLFGLKENELLDDSYRVANDQIVDVTRVNVFQNGEISSARSSVVAVDIVPGGVVNELPQRLQSEPTTFNAVQDLTADEHVLGWRFAFQDPLEPNPDTLAARRIRAASGVAFSGSNVLVSAYQGTGLSCTSEGNGLLYVVDMTTGLPPPYAPLSVDSRDRINRSSVDGTSADYNRVLSGTSVGLGFPSEPKVIRPSNATSQPPTDSLCDTFRAMGQSSTGAVTNDQVNDRCVPPGRKAWREVPITW